jgi:hypothetical protein
MRVYAGVFGVLGVLVSQAASAQYSKDNTSPPIEVPTAPVAQGTAPAPPPAAKPPPKPAPAPPAGAPAPAPAPAPDKKDDKKETAPAPPPSYNNEGVFKISGTKGSGVVGGGSAKKGTKATTAAPATAAKGTKVAAAKKSTAMIAQWPGFRLTDDGGSEVMVEFSQNPSSPTEHKAAGSVTYVFKGAHVIKHNNQNPLITVHFNTPVSSAKLVPKKGELHLVVDMRAAAAPTFGLRASSDGDGQQFFVKFPSGSWLPKGAENEEMPPPPTQKLKAKGEGTKDTPPSSAPPPKTEGGAKTGPNP